MKRPLLSAGSLLLGPALMLAQPALMLAQSHGSADLRVFFADVEGGQATMFVAPTGESLLVDTGWEDRPGAPRARDAERILELCRMAGVGRIDTVLITHFHEDHVGGFPALADRIAIGQVLDHGPNREGPTAESGAATLAVYQSYLGALRKHGIAHHTVGAGDRLPTPGFEAVAVSSDGRTLLSPLPGGLVAGSDRANPACSTSPERPAEETENDRSLGFLLAFGRSRILDLGDLTWNRERPLACPRNLLGRVDLLVVSHHGFDHSSSPALLAGIRPRVAIMDNGATKGASVSSWQTVQSSSGELWQMHTAEASGARNVAEDHIANLRGTPDHGFPLLVRVSDDGAISVRNPRTGREIVYPAP